MQSFSNPITVSVPDVTLNAYIVFALTAVGVTDVANEVTALKNFADF